ncbi:MAG TPA: arylsulfotransferase family protein, partial [Burkholderiaceae bacterium]
MLGGVVVALGSAATLAVASQRIQAEQAAFRTPSASRCYPSTLNAPATLAGTNVSVSPLPNSYDASSHAQISMVGASAQSLSHVRVSGSDSGSHGGHLRAYSQGDGASFVPSKPFSQGETVTVRGEVSAAGRARRFAYRFVVATKDVLPYLPQPPPSGKDYNEKQHFRSAPSLEAPLLNISANTPQASPGDIFAAPYSGPGPPGPMIVDGAGNLVWFDPLSTKVGAAANLQVQQLGDKPVLTWWQGYIPPQGFGQGEEIIYNTAYQQIGRVHAGNGYKADLHEFKLTPQGTALLTVFAPIDCDLSVVGGPSGGSVTDSIFQEIDLRTSLVRREWHSLDHVALGDSYSTPTGSSAAWPYDYFHINSIDQRADGTTLISARNTWALYVTNTANGSVQSAIGGKRSSSKLGAGTHTAYQHDATTLANGTISVFDNGAVPKVHPQSRGLVLSLGGGTVSAV